MSQALEIKPVDAFAVEDSVGGITVSVCAGATVIGFARESPTHPTPEVLHEVGVILIITHMVELPALIR